VSFNLDSEGLDLRCYILSGKTHHGRATSSHHSISFSVGMHGDAVAVVVFVI
jgi:hypothetical protein